MALRSGSTPSTAAKPSRPPQLFDRAIGFLTGVRQSQEDPSEDGGSSVAAASQSDSPNDSPAGSSDASDSDDRKVHNFTPVNGAKSQTGGPRGSRVADTDSPAGHETRRTPVSEPVSESVSLEGSPSIDRTISGRSRNLRHARFPTRPPGDALESPPTSLAQRFFDDNDVTLLARVVLAAGLDVTMDQLVLAVSEVFNTLEWANLKEVTQGVDNTTLMRKLHNKFKSVNGSRTAAQVDALEYNFNQEWYKQAEQAILMRLEPLRKSRGPVVSHSNNLRGSSRRLRYTREEEIMFRHFMIQGTPRSQIVTRYKGARKADMIHQKFKSVRRAYSHHPSEGVYEKRYRIDPNGHFNEEVIDFCVPGPIPEADIQAFEARVLELLASNNESSQMTDNGDSDMFIDDGKKPMPVSSIIPRADKPLEPPAVARPAANNVLFEEPENIASVNTTLSAPSSAPVSAAAAEPAVGTVPASSGDAGSSYRASDVLNLDLLKDFVELSDKVLVEIDSAKRRSPPSSAGIWADIVGKLNANKSLIQMALAVSNNRQNGTRLPSEPQLAYEDWETEASTVLRSRQSSMRTTQTLTEGAPAHAYLPALIFSAQSNDSTASSTGPARSRSESADMESSQSETLVPKRRKINHVARFPID